KRQLKAMAEKRVIVEPTLAEQLAPFIGSRIGFLDFETIIRAIPVWPGMAPWQQAAAQFSYHERQPDGTYTHVGYLAEGPEDGRVASVEIARLLFVADKIPKHERDRVRQDLLNYCERDTWAMVRLVERLRELAQGK